MKGSEVIRPDVHAGRTATHSSSIFGGFRSVRRVTGGLHFVAEYEGTSLSVQFLQDGVVRLTTLARTGEVPSPTPALVHVPRPECGVEVDAGVEDDGTEVRIAAGGTSVRFRRGVPGCQVVWMGGHRNPAQPALTMYEWMDAWWEDNGVLTACHRRGHSDRFYGLGEKPGFLNKANDRYGMWNSDIFDPHVPDTDALYVSIPFLIHAAEGTAYGLFLDNPGRTAFDMRSRTDAYVTEAHTGELDVYLIPGPSLKEVVRRYTSLTGRIQVPPRWALGYHQSRYSYASQEEVLTLASTFQDKDIPLDAIHLDIHHMREYRVFTFDPDRFPNPAELSRCLAARGIQLVAIVDPGVKVDPDYPVYQEGQKGDMFCKYPDGRVFEGPVWPGLSVFPDFTNDRVAEWWAGLHRFYVEQGVRGIWNDMNEPSVFNESKTMDGRVVLENHGRPRSHAELHNLYGLEMVRATQQGLLRFRPNERPFVLTRSGYAGVQRFAAVWTGDNRSYWEHMAMSIPMLLNLGLSGVPFVGADVGGFSHHANGELLARWTQLGTFYPFFRNHSCIDTVRQEPWAFGDEVEEICRRYIRLRYRWLPYLYGLFREAADTGLPVMRPLVLEYPDDVRTHELCDEFLVGNNLLVAPVLRPGDTERLVYLPQGEWFNYWTGDRLAGGRSHIVAAPLDTLPMFIRAGSVIPEQPPAASTSERVDEVTFHVWPSEGEGDDISRYYEDDGHSFEYRRGAYNLYEFRLVRHHDCIRLTWNAEHHGYEPGQRWRFMVHGLAGKRCIVLPHSHQWMEGHEAPEIEVQPSDSGWMEIRWTGEDGADKGV